MTDRAVVVVRAGALTTVQDLGRTGYAHLGVPRSGALDPAAVRLVNRLVGNPETAAVLETTVDGCALRPRCAVTVAVGGAPCPVRVDGRPAAWGTAVRVPAGSVLDIGAATRGLRAYVAVGGGIDVEPVLGSRSTDLLSGLGPPPAAEETVLPLGPDTGTGTGTGTATAVRGSVDAPPWPGPPDELVLRVRLGPRDDWFTAAALRTLVARAYRVSSASNRIGLRLEGPALERSRHGEPASEGMVLGAVQVPPDGRPVVFLADHPTTGGYPVVGVVREVDLGAAAQAVPGTPVRFTPVR
ncbi:MULTISPECIES: biotin-dependent carboxyltransferase family protein [unclassified Streptomyces]|uniref:5-oxoprolinase subunit C family protein n=1 Tax=unclassified Streptomyces TaxID=2593676 RepID=UPI001E298591|nr:biotin-dependent carboxyltransferase family protein [Streptomyces sp. CB02980]MCB8908171.1 biotin-dependent carboxyltransferase family protein [Streptomyces sp. CB02980]